MRITKITLVGYKRLLLRNIRHITITPKEIVQVILGTNGSGKSSLMEQLSPLPAEPSAFTKDGKKVIYIDKNGLQYVCTSVFSPSAKHSFVVEGVEHNPGGTAKVQKDLVKDHFGITPDIHDLIRGAEKFTSMSTAKRREWFTLMCDTDYTFAMNAFDKIKERANALSGTVKMNKKNLVVEAASLMSADEEGKLEREVTDLLHDLALLNAERVPLEASSEHFLTERDRALRTLKELSMRLLRNRIIVPLEYADGRMMRDEWGGLKRVQFSSVEEIDAEIDRLRHLATSKEALMVSTNQQFDKLSRQFELLSKTGGEGVASLATKIDQLAEKRNNMFSSVRLGLFVNHAQSASDAYATIEEDFIQLMTDLPSNRDRRFGKASLAELQAKLLNVANQRMAVASEVQRLELQKEHADDHRGKDQLQCPQCRHTWTVGINAEQYQALTEKLFTLRTKFTALDKEQEQLSGEMKEMESYFAQYRQFMTFTKNVNSMAPFWEDILTSQLVLDSPLEVVNAFRTFKNDLAVMVDIQKIEAKIEETKRLRAQAEELGEANLDEVRKELDLLTEKLGVLTSEHTKLQRAISDYSEYRRQINTGHTLAEEVTRLYKLAQEQQYTHVETLRRESILHCIDQVERALALKQEALRSAKMQRHTVAKLEEQLENWVVQEEAAKLMVKALSPTSGLIAEGLLGFIRSFVGQMNAFIKKVWTYPLQIIPTGYDNEAGEQSSELDYKFPMLVDTEDNISPDVSKSSEGQSEIVNLSFRLISIRHLGLMEAPLFLDEPGRTLDDAHRFALSEVMKSLVENYNYSQLWIISHHVQTYGSFNVVEFCVLDPTNIVLPSNYPINSHVKIEM